MTGKEIKGKRGGRVRNKGRKLQKERERHSTSDMEREGENGK